MKVFKIMIIIAMLLATSYTFVSGFESGDNSSHRLSAIEMKSIFGDRVCVSSILNTDSMREIKGKGCNECWKLSGICGLRTCSSSPCSYCTDSSQPNIDCIPRTGKNCTPSTETGGCGLKWINGTCDGGYCSGGEQSGDCDRRYATGDSCS